MPENTATYRGYQPVFTKKDRAKTVLIPWFTDFLSPFIPAIAKLAGYHFVNCPRTSKKSAEIGLKYGNNEVCYPATLVLGDLIAEIQTGEYDLDNLAVAITQTGGQCRATNYLGLIKTGLTNAGFGHIPVISVSFGSVYQNEQPGFKLPFFRIFNITVYAFLFGDALNQLYAACVVRERNRGESERLFHSYMEKGEKIVLENKHKKLTALLEDAVDDFNRTAIFEERKYEKVGLIGEIFVKYNSYGQAHITEWLREQGIEVEVPPMIDFFMQTFVNQTVNHQNGIIHPGKIKRKLMPLLYRFLNKKMARFE
jgi:predicted nucleotide-binding protein (sugar kinase/HSP70/actin superfamily)